MWWLYPLPLMFSLAFGLDDNVFLPLLAFPIVLLVFSGLFNQAFDHATKLHVVIFSQQTHDLYVTMLQTTIDTLVRAICEPIGFTLFRLARQVVRTALVIVYHAALCIGAAVLRLRSYLPHGMKGIALVGVWAGTFIENAYHKGFDYLDSGMTRVLTFLTTSVIKSVAILRELKERVARRPMNDIPIPTSTPLPPSASVTISNQPRAHFTVPVIECVSPVGPTRANFPLPSLAERTTFHRLTSTDLVSAYQYGYYSIAKPFITGTSATDAEDADASAPMARNEESNESVTQVKDVEVSLEIQDLLETPTSCGLLSGRRYRRYLITKACALPCSSVSNLQELPAADQMPLVVTIGPQFIVDSPFAPVRVLPSEPQDADITLVADEDALDHGGSSLDITLLDPTTNEKDYSFRDVITYNCGEAHDLSLFESTIQHRHSISSACLGLDLELTSAATFARSGRPSFCRLVKSNSLRIDGTYDFQREHLWEGLYNMRILSVLYDAIRIDGRDMIIPAWLIAKAATGSIATARVLKSLRHVSTSAPASLGLLIAPPTSSAARILATPPIESDLTTMPTSPTARPSPQMARPTVQSYATPTSSSGPSSSSASIHPAADVGEPKTKKPRRRTKKKSAQGDMVTTELNASSVPDLLAAGDYSSLTLTPSIFKSRQALSESDLEASSAVASTSSRLNSVDQYDHLLCSKSGAPSSSDAVPQHRKPFKKTRRGRDKQKKANATLRASGVCGNGCGGLCY